MPPTAPSHKSSPVNALGMQAGQLEAQVDRRAELAGWAASATTFCRRVQAGLADTDFARKRQLVELLIDRVLVTDDEVEIRYVIPLRPDSERVRFCHLRKDYFGGRRPSQACSTVPQPANRSWSGASIAGVSAGFISAI